MKPGFCLTLSGQDRPGIVAAITTCLAQCGANIIEAQQFDDVLSGRFFMRVEFVLTRKIADNLLSSEIAHASQAMGLDWQLRDTIKRKRVLILVSRFDHCLADLLYRCNIGELEMDVVGIVSNHPRETFGHLDFGEVSFHHLPTDPDPRQIQEDLLRKVIVSSEADLIILARYMQILSDELVGLLKGRCINIHHSFLPAFKGARPYHQAHAKGVKLIGATAHFVTNDLDAGPIIEQDVERVDHRDSPADLVRKGRDIERRVLSRAVRAFLEDRIIQNGNTTVVF